MVSCVPYCLIVVTAGASLADIGLMGKSDLTPSALGRGFWVLAIVAAVLAVGGVGWAVWCRTHPLPTDHSLLGSFDSPEIGPETAR